VVRRAGLPDLRRPHLGAGFCLRGAGDMRVRRWRSPSFPGSVSVPSPTCHVRSRTGWWIFLPQFGYGTVGGWAVALVTPVFSAASSTCAWRSGAWAPARPAVIWQEKHLQGAITGDPSQWEEFHEQAHSFGRRMHSGRRCIPLVRRALPEAQPEDVGLSSQRLARLDATMQKAVDSGELPGWSS